MQPPPAARLHVRLGMMAVVASILVPLPVVVPSVVEANRYLVTPDQVVREDMYVVANSAVVEGTIEGDLIIASNTVLITGTVTGDVVVASLGTVSVDGIVGGSVRGIARSFAMSGEVGDELAVVAGSTVVTGAVGRDVLSIAATLDLAGSVGRDVRGRFLNADISGDIGRDVDIAVQSAVGSRSLRVGPGAAIDGDFLYRSGRDASIDESAVIGGLTTRLPTRPAFSTEIIIRLARILGFMGFVFGGIVVLWLFRATAPAAADRSRRHPWRSIGLGLLTLFAVPALALVFGATLVGIPFALLVLFGWLLLLFFGPMPALAAWGGVLVGGRGAPYTGFVTGALGLFGLLWLWYPAGVALYLGALVMGSGSWLAAGWQHRSEHDEAEDDESGMVTTGSAIADDEWEPPLPPGPNPRPADAGEVPGG